MDLADNKLVEVNETSSFSLTSTLNEKYLSPAVILTIEDVGADCALLFKSLALDRKRRGHLVLNVFVDPSCSPILDQMMHEKADNFLIMDVVTGSEKANYTCKPPLHEISITLKEARRLLSNLAGGRDDRENVGVFIFFWTLNPLLINFNAKDVLRFYYENCRESIKYGTTEFYLLQEGIVEETTLKRLMALSHAVWSLQRLNSRDTHYHSLDILKMNGRCPQGRNMLYRIEGNEFIFEKKIPRRPLSSIRLHAHQPIPRSHGF